MSIDLPTTPAATALFAAYSQSLETHAHLIGREKDKALASIKKTEEAIAQAMVDLAKTRRQLESPTSSL